MEPSETPFDLRFWLFGTHVRVSPWFWLMSAVLGWDGIMRGGDTQKELLYLAVWMVCVFVSILLHEFGHIWMGRLFGSHGHIVLHSLGGLAVGSNALNRGWQRFIVAFAGPLIQFVFFGVVLMVTILALPTAPQQWQEPVGRTLDFLLEINLFWPILNLFPIWPLDGGQMSREVCLAVSPRNGVHASLVISACVAGLAAFHCVFPDVLGQYIPWIPIRQMFAHRDIFLAIFFALFCYQSILALTMIRAAQARRYSDDEVPWER